MFFYYRTVCARVHARADSQDTRKSVRDLARAPFSLSLSNEIRKRDWRTVHNSRDSEQSIKLTF